MKLNIRDPLNFSNNVGRSTFNLYFLKVYYLYLVDNVLSIHYNMHELISDDIYKISNLRFLF